MACRPAADQREEEDLSGPGLRHSAARRPRISFWVVLVVSAAAVRTPGQRKTEPRARLVKRGPLAWDNATPEQAAIAAEHGLTRLMVHAIADNSFLQFVPIIRTFLYDCKLRGLALNDTSSIDWALTCYMDDMCYVKQGSFNHASKLYSGLVHLDPDLRNHLPCAARALIGWSRLDNAAEGGPIPLEAIGLLIDWMLKHKMFMEAFVTLLAYDAFLRESDWETLVAGDVSIVYAAPDSLPEVALLLGSGARGLSTKTGTDQGVVLEHSFLRCWAAAITRRLESKEALVPFSQVQFRKAWRQGWNAIQLDFGPAHSLRHSGPAHSVLMKTRSLEEIRRRGRWQSLKSVQRYTKAHLILEKRAKMSDEQRQIGTKFWDTLGSHIMGDAAFDEAVEKFGLASAREDTKPGTESTAVCKSCANTGIDPLGKRCACRRGKQVGLPTHGQHLFGLPAPDGRFLAKQGQPHKQKRRR